MKHNEVQSCKNNTGVRSTVAQVFLVLFDGKNSKLDDAHFEQKVQ